MPNLSNKALDFINNLRFNKPKEDEQKQEKWSIEIDRTELEKEADSILKQPSMSEKYAELIDGSGLVLPLKYKELLSLFSA